MVPKSIVEQSRSSRKGPKKPPLSRKSHDNSNPKETQPPIDKMKNKIKIKGKRREYFETLDEIDNPNVNEQIMLGEMAFTQNEASLRDTIWMSLTTTAMILWHPLLFINSLGYNTISEMSIMPFRTWDGLEWIETGCLNQKVLRMAVPTDLELFKSLSNTAPMHSPKSLQCRVNYHCMKPECILTLS